MHESSAQKEKPLLPARRFAAGGEKRGWRVRRRLVQNHWLHPDKLGGGRKPTSQALKKQ